MNMSIDNRYCNRFIHIGRPIFSVNRSSASVYNPDDIWERACTVLHLRGTAHPICDPSRIIATRQLNALTVPWSHNVSNNCIYIHSYLLRWYKLNCNRFNHCERPIFSCDQAALQMVFSVCLSVRLSVCPSVRLSVTPFWLYSHHRIIMKFSGVITNDQRKVHAKGQGQRSKVKVTEVTTQLNRFRTVTPVWIHIWWWNDAYSLMLLRRGALLFFKVIRQISRSHGSKNRRIWPRLAVSGL